MKIRTYGLILVGFLDHLIVIQMDRTLKIFILYFILDEVINIIRFLFVCRDDLLLGFSCIPYFHSYILLSG